MNNSIQNTRHRKLKTEHETKQEPGLIPGAPEEQTDNAINWVSICVKRHV